ncbi:MAG: sulfatase [Myxococcota bacterium]|nr:sulfatase [Myxococcota bacterium]
MQNGIMLGLIVGWIGCGESESTQDTPQPKQAAASSQDPNIPPPPPNGERQALPPLDVNPGQNPPVNQPGVPQQPKTLDVVKAGPQLTTAEPPAEQKSASSSAACSDCDVILISVCSLRKDYVGAYGLTPSPTPNIDSLADEGYLFDQTYAASNFTLAGLTAMLTGHFGASTGVTGWDKGLTKDLPTLPEVLGYYGYKTAAFTMDAASGFRPDYGLHRGFQRMELTTAPRSTPDGRYQPTDEEPVLEGDGASADPAVTWLSQQEDNKPIFLMFHDRTAHYPFVITNKDADKDKTGLTQLLWEAGHENQNRLAPNVAMPGMAGGTKQKGVVDIHGNDPVHDLLNKGGAEALQLYKNHYRDGVARMDKDIEKLIQAQKDRKRFDKTMWILVADHGESLGDHNELLHGASFYNSVINVPFIIKAPGFSGKKEKISALISHVDILPTILDYIGATQPSGIDGTSIMPIIEGKSKSIRSVAISEGGVAQPIGDMPGAVIAPPWSLLLHEIGCDGPAELSPPRKPGEVARCLYNIDEDPLQDKLVSHEHKKVVDSLYQFWKDFRKERTGKSRQMTLDPSFIQELQRSGYDFRSPEK